MIVLSVILSECDVSFPAMVNVFALSSTAAMMPLKGVARTLPPDAAAAAGEVSASVELLAAGEGEVFFSAAWVGNGKQMTRSRKTRLLLQNYCVSCVDEVPLTMLMRHIGASYERCCNAKIQGLRFDKL